MTENYIVKNGIIIKIDKDIIYSKDDEIIISKCSLNKSKFTSESIRDLLEIEKKIRLSKIWLDQIKCTNEVDSDRWIDISEKLQESLIDAHFGKISEYRRQKLLFKYRNIKNTFPEHAHIPIQVVNNRVITLEKIKAKILEKELTDITLHDENGKENKLSNIIGNNKVLILSGSIT
jgi:hypothetical protein